MLVPAVNQLQPDLILVSAGFDSREDDLLGCHKITDQGFAQLTMIVKALAEKHCHCKLVSVLEGQRVAVLVKELIHPWLNSTPFADGNPPDK